MYGDRERYLAAIKAQVEPNVLAHCLALEACMGGVYDYLAERGELGAEEPPREDWLLAGLVHDVDFGGEFKEEHPKKTMEALAKYDLSISPEMHELILMHAMGFDGGIEPKSKAGWAIFCADSLTGLIVAVTLILPTKKLEDVKLSSVVKRFFKEPKFAAGTRRDDVARCAEADTLNIPVETFIEVCLDAMKGIAGEIGL
jgi:predicted hydrolase (HD superfamily)